MDLRTAAAPAGAVRHPADVLGARADSRDGRFADLESGAKPPRYASNDAAGAPSSSTDVLWWGPHHLGCFVLELHGPLQLLVLGLALVAFLLLVIQLSTDHEDVLHAISAVGFFAVSVYLAWMSKAMYVLKHFRKQIVRFRELNKDLAVRIEDLSEQNVTYEHRNLEHGRLNCEHEALNTGLKAEVAELATQNDLLQHRNAQFEQQNHELNVLNLKFKKQLGDLADETSAYTDQNQKHREQVACLEGLNDKLSVELEELQAQSKIYQQQNASYERLNQDLFETNADLKAQVAVVASQNGAFRGENAQYKTQNKLLLDNVKDLQRVEAQLAVFTRQCHGSVSEARVLLERLERDLRLNTVNTVFLFFDRADLNRNGKIDPEEVPLFVNNLSFLWRHLPCFDQDQLQTRLVRQGGVTLEQVHELVNSMMMEDHLYNPRKVGPSADETASTAPSSNGFAGSISGGTCADDAASSVGGGYWIR